MNEDASTNVSLASGASTKTAVLLYGMALLYGATGATTLVDISKVITGTPTPAALLSVTMLVAGLGLPWPVQLRIQCSSYSIDDIYVLV